MKRFAAMLVVSVLMVLWIASGDRMSAGQRTDGLYYEVTGIHPDAVLMRINGEDISAEEYLYWLAYDCEYLTSYVPKMCIRDSGLQEKVSFLQKNAGKALTLPRQKPGSPQKSTGIP